MAIYKCKMCGGDLEVAEGVTVVECDYCGTKQTVPTSNDEEIRNLFNRANLLRRKCEFDKAEEFYEKILLKDEKQSEAYWCVLLCRYGIEYVEDPKTDKRIPTCHRTSFEAITSDEYYKLALKHADPVQKKIYEEEAKYIDGVQKEILALSQKEEPYDVFICYKETDENGKRTEDSAIANDIYYQLTQEGYKVFYAAITLEDKLGSAYEPIIFAALHSSKVMLALGTKPEYFNAVWVKNEWSRFLKLMKTDKKKQLIPCYRGMDAYELPEEFAHLQAQDMGKIGFINDLVRGIKKVISKEEPKKETPKDAATTAGVNSLLRRMYLFLEDNDWAHATEYAERVLDIDPENAEAYLGELLAELNHSKISSLHIHPESFEYLPLFKKAYRFADEELKGKLDKAVEENEKFRENKRQGDIYANALKQEMAAHSEQAFLDAAASFESIPNFKDSAECAKRCKEKAEQKKAEAAQRAARAKAEAAQRAELAERRRKEQIYQGACNNLKCNDIAKLIQVCEDFKLIRGFRDSDEKIAECESKIEQLRFAKKEAIYTASCGALSAEDMESVSKARKDFEVLGDFKDSKQKIAECDKRIAELKKIAEEKARQEAIIAAKRKKKKIVIGIVSGTIAVLVIIAIIVAVAVTNHNEKVARAGLTYTLSADNSYYIVSGVDKGERLDDCIIPASYHNLPVKGIGSAAFKKSDIKSITIPSTITRIGEYAFSECTDLTKVNITNLSAWCKIDFEGGNGSSNPLNLAKHLFLNGTEVKDLVIPQGITEIKPYAFYHCAGLQKVTIPDNVTKIGAGAFTGCDSLQSVTIGSGVTSIGDSAFFSCSGLASIDIPNSVTSIGNSAFSGCSGLTSVFIPNGVISVGDSAFKGCSGLQSVTIGSGVTGIGDDLFSGCDSLTTAVWNAENCTNTVHRYNIFNDCPNLTNVTIGENVKTIPAYAFCRCSKITSIVIPNSVTSIGEGAFRECSGLQSVTIGSGVTSIGGSAFYNCDSLTEIIIPNSVTSIGNSAFYGCDKLTSVTIGTGVTVIGQFAFFACSELKNAYFLDPNGWKRFSSSWWSSGTELGSSNLSNSATAATFLISGYVDYEWRKS